MRTKTIEVTEVEHALLSEILRSELHKAQRRDEWVGTPAHRIHTLMELVDKVGQP